MTEFRPTRRIVFHGLGAVGVAAVLAGCGGDSSDDKEPTTGGSGKENGGSGALAATSDVPVGGGIVLTDEKVVITQPTEGEFLAFTAVCTHQGFTVGRVEDGTIVCEVHGSTYDAETGEATGGPAPDGLAKVGIKVEGDQILRA